MEARTATKSEPAKLSARDESIMRELEHLRTLVDRLEVVAQELLERVER